MNDLALKFSTLLSPSIYQKLINNFQNSWKIVCVVCGPRKFLDLPNFLLYCFVGFLSPLQSKRWLSFLSADVLIFFSVKFAIKETVQEQRFSYYFGEVRLFLFSLLQIPCPIKNYHHNKVTLLVFSFGSQRTPIPPRLFIRICICCFLISYSLAQTSAESNEPTKRFP